MNAIEPATGAVTEPEAGFAAFNRVFRTMHAATRRSPVVKRGHRQVQLDALFALVDDNADSFATAISAEFVHRSVHETRLL